MIEPDFASEKRLKRFIAQFCPHAAKSVLFGNLECLADVQAFAGCDWSAANETTAHPLPMPVAACVTSSHEMYNRMGTTE